jgi:single-stranded-DNA-specific exonuclease
VVDLATLDMGQAEELMRLGPFGAANPEPLFGLRGVTTSQSRVVGEKHLQLTLVDDVGQADAIAFNMATHDPGRGTRVDVLAAADIDSYRGVRRTRLRVRQLSQSLP